MAKQLCWELLTLCVKPVTARLCCAHVSKLLCSLMRGQASLLLLQAWAVMEARQRDSAVVRHLFGGITTLAPSCTWPLSNFSRCAKPVAEVSAAPLQAWAVMEARQGDLALVRDLFRAGLAESPRSPFLHLAFGQWERQQGSLETARFLLRRGCQLNPADPALAVVRPAFQLCHLPASGLWAVGAAAGQPGDSALPAAQRLPAQRL